MYTYIHIHIYIHIYIYIYIHIYICTYTCKSACIYVYVCLYQCVYISTRMFQPCDPPRRTPKKSRTSRPVTQNVKPGGAVARGSDIGWCVRVEEVEAACSEPKEGEPRQPNKALLLGTVTGFLGLPGLACMTYCSSVDPGRG